MPLFTAHDLDHARGLDAINAANPFLPERLDLERRVLGDAYVEVGAARSLRPQAQVGNPNNQALLERAEALLGRARTHLADDDGITRPDLKLYEGVVIFTLYHRWSEQLFELGRRAEEADRVHVSWFERFQREAQELLHPPGRQLPLSLEPEHLLALYFQVARAFQQIYTNLLGTSAAAVRLRAAVWQSIFTHDIRRYQRSLYRHMRDLATLVTGPSGTGKELVAQAIGLSSYIPFDSKASSFATDAAGRFLPLNLTALSPTLIESELFGHKSGAFTGALADRKGWFEVCPPHGAVFLDEIGDVAAEIQVKLLRVLQTRTFQRLGESRSRPFPGKLISATNRDLERAIGEHRFREDLYYRICSDRIVTPSLAEQIDGSMDELRTLALFIADHLVGGEAPDLADEVVAWVESRLGRDYPWPGNFRELEQCVRSVLVRKEYRPAATVSPGVREGLEREFGAAQWTADELLRTYCTLVYSRAGSFEGAARRLGLDRRTVKAKLDAELLARLGIRSRTPSSTFGPGAPKVEEGV